MILLRNVFLEVFVIIGVISIRELIIVAKKLLIFIICIGVLLSNISFAQSNDKTKSIDNGVELKAAFEEVSKIISPVKENDTLKLANQYYSLSNPKIEAATKSEYKRIVNWNPNFTGSKPDVKKAKEASASVALGISYTNAKNFYLSMASAVFALDPKSAVGAGNFASAIASYHDDLVLEGQKDKNMGKYYEDAIKIYNYGLQISIKDKKFNKDALPLLVSLGNLYMDTGKKDRAYTCFRMAMAVEKDYWPARKSMYNYYMSEKKFDEALKLMMEENQYPLFVRATSKIKKIKEGEEKKTKMPEGQVSDQVMERHLDSLTVIAGISQADFLEGIDKEAQLKLKNLIKNVENKMRYKAPDIRLLTKYSSLEQISTPLGQSDLEAFREGVENYSKLANYMGAKMGKDYMGNLGFETDLGGFETMEDLVGAMGSNPEFDLQINFDWLENSDAISEEFIKKLENDVAEYEKNPDKKPTELLKTVSKFMSEKAVLALNPFEYANPIDVYIQQLNIMDFDKKFSSYSVYLVNQTRKSTDMIYNALEDAERRNNRAIENIINMERKISDMYAKDPERARLEIHKVVHTGMIPQLNKDNQVVWNQVTQLAITQYEKKIRKYVEKMYKDCMKHVILISDEKVQRELEDRVNELVVRTVYFALQDISEAFAFNGIYYQEPQECGCDTAALEASIAVKIKEENRLANEQIKKNMEAKRKFEAGELDENSEYYKKIIKPYEVHINTPYFTGKVGPYKSGYKINLAHGQIGAIDFSKMQQHIRNTTTYDGGVEIKLLGAEVGGFGGDFSIFGRFNGTSGSNQSLSLGDISVSGGAKVDLSAPGFMTGTIGIEGSSVRGSKTYGGFGFSGDSLLNDDLKAALGNWKPNLTLEVWNGEYDH